MKITRENLVVNLIWRFAERCGAQFVAFVVALILARILEPEVYGTIALINVFTAILQIFVDSGLGNALIQKKDADETDFSTVFYVNIVFCIILYSIIFAAAPLIAAFYGNMDMTMMLRVLGLTIVISGVKNVQQAYVSRNLMFKKFFFSTLGGTIMAAILGILAALKGFGIWALIIQQLVNLFIDTLILWITVKWRPKRLFSVSRLKELLSYGWKLLVSALIDTGYNNLRQLIIGKMYSAGDLAYYERGKQFPEFIVGNINSSIDSVLLPAMSNVQDKRESVKNMTRKSIKVSIYIMSAFMIGLFVTAPSVIKILLTDKWLPSIPYLRIFCISYMFWPVHTSNLNAIKAMGRSDLFLKLEIIKKCMGLTLLFISMHYGIMAMAYSLLVSDVMSQIINSWPNRKLLDYGYLEQLKDILPSILLAAVMGIVVWLIGLLHLPVLGLLILQILGGAVFYIAGSAVLKNDSFLYLWDMVRPVVGRYFG